MCFSMLSREVEHYLSNYELVKLSRSNSGRADPRRNQYENCARPAAHSCSQLRADGARLRTMRPQYRPVPYPATTHMPTDQSISCLVASHRVASRLVSSRLVEAQHQHCDRSERRQHRQRRLRIEFHQFAFIKARGRLPPSSARLPPAAAAESDTCLSSLYPH